MEEICSVSINDKTSIFSVQKLLEKDNRSPTSNKSSIVKRRKRCSFNAMQVKILEEEFYRQRYLSSETRTRLADLLGLTQQQVKIWFQNRRYKSKPKNSGSDGHRINDVICDETDQMNRSTLLRPVFVLIDNGLPTLDYFAQSFPKNLKV